MANVTIPASAPSERALAHARISREKAEEAARQRASTIDAPWYDEKGATMDPNNFGRDDLDPQHVAMFNGSSAGRRAANFPERTLDTGLHFNPTPAALSLGGSGSGASDRDSVSTHHPEILTAIIQDLWSPSTSHGALGQSLAVATDAPPSISGPSEPPMTIAPPLDPEDLPPPPEMEVLAPEGSSRAKRQADWKAQSEENDKAEQQRQKDEKKREADEKKRREEQQQSKK